MTNSKKPGFFTRLRSKIIPLRADDTIRIEAIATDPLTYRLAPLPRIKGDITDPLEVDSKGRFEVAGVRYRLPPSDLLTRKRIAAFCAPADNGTWIATGSDSEHVLRSLAASNPHIHVHSRAQRLLIHPIASRTVADSNAESIISCARW